MQKSVQRIPGPKKPFCAPTDELLWAKDDLSFLTEKVVRQAVKFQVLKKAAARKFACNIRYLNDILLSKNKDRFCTVSRSRPTCKLGGSNHPQSPTVNCLSEESDIVSYLAHSAKLPTGIYILPSVVSFFFNFLTISRRQIISGSTRPIFANFHIIKTF